MLDTSIHTFVMAGGTGTRLQPLTQQQCKPALPFGAEYRVIDFVLANLHNSGLSSANLLVQYEPETLARHVQQCWQRSAAAAGATALLKQPGFEVALLAPNSETGPGFYRGTADAVFQNLHRLQIGPADLVLVFGADHVYRMDLRQMIDFHLTRGADVTVATLPVPLAEASAFGIAATDSRCRIQRFLEKPAQPPEMPGRPGHALASMGNYIFSAAVLREALNRAIQAGEYDFGTHVLPKLLASHRVMAYDFHSNRVAGVAAHEEAAYWRDVGTLDAYFEAQLDTLGRSPRFAIDNPRWPLLNALPRGASQVTRIADSEITGSHVAGGALLDGVRLQQCVVRPQVQVARGSELQQCVLLDGASIGTGARLRKVIVDSGNAIPHGEVIGFDARRDRARFPVTRQGVVVVPSGFFPAASNTPRRGDPQALHAFQALSA